MLLIVAHVLSCRGLGRSLAVIKIQTPTLRPLISHGAVSPN